MKKTITSILYTFLVITALLFHGCKKIEEEQSEKVLATTMLTDDINADSLKSHIEWLESMGTRFALAENRRSVAVMIRNRFISYGYTDARLDSFEFTRTYNNLQYITLQYNVIAKLEGSENPDSVCIMGAHHDNILRSGTGNPLLLSYGANDNASGVAAALEIARVMKKNDYQPRNTIMFVTYAAEEFGLHGSKDHAAKISLSDMKVKFMLNNDMIAYQPSEVKSQWVVDILDYENSGELRYRAQELLRKYTGIYHINDNTYNKQSDSYSYSLKGYPSIFFFGYASDPNYHTPADRSEECNFEFCREIVKVSCAVLVDANTFD